MMLILCGFEINIRHIQNNIMNCVTPHWYFQYFAHRFPCVYSQAHLTCKNEVRRYTNQNQARNLSTWYTISHILQSMNMKRWSSLWAALYSMYEGAQPSTQISRKTGFQTWKKNTFFLVTLLLGFFWIHYCRAATDLVWPTYLVENSKRLRTTSQLSLRISDRFPVRTGTISSN